MVTGQDFAVLTIYIILTIFLLTILEFLFWSPFQLQVEENSLACEVDLVKIIQYRKNIDTFEILRHALCWPLSNITKNLSSK